MTGIYNPTNSRSHAFAAVERMEDLLQSSQQDPFLYKALRVASHVVLRSGILLTDGYAQRGKFERHKAECLQNDGLEKKKADDIQMN